MTTQQNAPVLDKHEREVKRLFIINLWEREFAQTLANLEALNNRLAEIDRIAKHPDYFGGDEAKITDILYTLASGHTQGEAVTPSPCPKCHSTTGNDWEQCEGSCPMPASPHSTPSPCPECARKDEELAAFKAEVSDKFTDIRDRGLLTKAQIALLDCQRFITPPADPVAEALKAAVYAYGGEMLEGENFDRALAELKSRLGGAK